MEYKWLNKNNNQNIIIFFNGWGMDESIVNHLEFDNYDVLMFYNYNTLKTDFKFSLLNIYRKKYLVAWSMGVMTAALFDINYTGKTAINGTLKPIDDEFGIPKRIYNLTLKSFSPASAEKFIKNMFNENTKHIQTCDIKRDFEEQKTELEALTHYEANPEFKYNKIILSSDDKIIPTKNQIAFWKIKPNIQSGHAPFYLYKKWSELL